MENQFNTWLNKIHQEEIPTSIIAYNFGIFEGEETYVLYLIGSNKFNEDNNDWACNEDFSPKEKYFHLNDISSDSNWEVVQNHVITLIKNYFVNDAPKNSFFKSATAITVGFDDSDLMRIL